MERRNPPHPAHHAGEHAAKHECDLDTLIGRLRFSPAEGRIWFDNMPVVMVRTSALSSLNREMVEILGQREAGYILARLGFGSGVRDAQAASDLCGGRDVLATMAVGQLLRSIRGVMSMKPVKEEIDLASDHFYSEAIFTGDFEADVLSNDGMAHSPVCWMQVGFATGLATTLLGRPAIFKEIECRASGSRHCRVVGKFLEEWHADEIETELQCVPSDLLQGRRPMAAHRAFALAPEMPDRAEIAPGIVGCSDALAETWSRVHTVAQTPAVALLLGETGVGKGIFAYALHQASRRRDKPFVAMNCAAIPENLLEAELFGVQKGAYTGATRARPGRFERAEGGTLFLDEVGCLSMPAQLKLLRAIQDKEIERVGDSISRRVDVRIIAATNEKLADAVARGRFREDLLYRLNVFPIHIAPLRERREDIPHLLRFFVDRYSKRYGRRIAGFTDAAAAAFHRYDYPGNVRELENLVERAVILGEDDQPIDIIHLFGVEGLVSSMLAAPAHQGEERREATAALCSTLLDEMAANHTALKDVEETLLRHALAKSDGNVSKAARLMGLSRAQFAYRLDKIERDPG